MKKILILNCGSSSIKYRLFGNDYCVLLSGLIEKIGEKGTRLIHSKGKKTLKEEMPEAYKDVSQVIEVVHSAGLAVKVARLRPLGVIKG